MIVMKFGGTSVANSEAIKRAIEIVRGRLDRRPMVVVSALSKVTDMLYKISDAAKACDKDLANDYIAQLRARHLTLVDELLGNSELRAAATNKVNEICDSLRTLVDAVAVVGELTPRSKAKIISNGEILSSCVISYAMNEAGIKTRLVDARELIITEGDYLRGEPVIDEIERRVPEVIGDDLDVYDSIITQGFVSAGRNGETMVLGRGGSDYSASLIGMALNAEAIEIWTDVDGVKTADPRRVANTRSIQRISFEEAAEMAHFGAKVLHPLTIEPAVMKNIPVYVLNSHNPDGQGTEILQSDQIEEGVKSVSFKENIYVVNIFSARMINLSGFLKKVFEIFAEYQVSVDLISTSEANISLTLDSGQDLTGVIERLSEVAEVHVDDDKSQVSIIGKNVVNQRGLLRWAMTALNNANIYMISQAASSDNLSFVVDRDKLDEVLQEFHNYLFAY